MQKQYQIILKDFLLDIYFKDKSFLVNAHDSLELGVNGAKENLFVYFKIYFAKIYNDLQIKVELYDWSYKLQKLVPIENSVWKDDDKKIKQLDKVLIHYENIINNFLDIFTHFRYFCQLKEVLNSFETRNYIYHYKLLNTFSKDELEKLCNKLYDIDKRLNTPLLKNKVATYHRQDILFPDYVDGLSGFNIDISVTFDKKDFAVIKNFDDEISKNECLRLLNI